MKIKSSQKEALSKWRNVWCDVISAYSHIHDSRDIFVTNNTKDFEERNRILQSRNEACLYT